MLASDEHLSYAGTPCAVWRVGHFGPVSPDGQGDRSNWGGGGRREGWGGGLAARPGWGLRATYYYLMHTSRGCVCLGAWGYRGMYAIIAISRLCPEDSLKGLKDERHSTPFNSAWDKKIGAIGATAPAPQSFKTRGEGGGGLGGVAYKDRVQLPPRGLTTTHRPASNHQCRTLGSNPRPLGRLSALLPAPVEDLCPIQTGLTHPWGHGVC